MTSFCFSIPVHEEPLVVKNQVQNIRALLPNTFIILHLSLISFQMRESLQRALSDLPDVYINPVSYPTRWGWFLHAHLFNYEYAKKLGIPFDYFLMDTSNALLIRPGAEDHISRFDFLSDCEHIRLEELETAKDHWGFPIALRDDVSFLKMTDSLGCKDFYASAHEGTAYKRELFDEMYKVFARFYDFHLLEPRYPKEEIYLSTVARALSSKYSNPITWRTIFHRKGIRQMEDPKTIVDSIRATGSYKYWNPHKEDPDYGKNYYGFRGIARKIDDPLRQYITACNLHK